MPTTKLRARSWSQNALGSSVFTEMGFVPVDNPDLASKLVGTEITVEYTEITKRQVGGRQIQVDGQQFTVGGREVPALVGARIIDFDLDQTSVALLAKAEKMGLKPHDAYVRPGRTTVTSPVAAAASIA